MKNDIKLLATAKLTSKGQITIPKKIRETLKLNNGDTVLFYLDENYNVKILNLKECNLKLDKNIN